MDLNVENRDGTGASPATLNSLPDTLTKKDIKRSHTLNFDQPMVPPEYKYKMERFGFPRPMQELAASLKKAITRIPIKDENDLQLRDLFLSLLASKNSTNDADFVQKALAAIGANQANSDLLAQRINTMTPAELIVGKEYQTPDQQTVESLRASLLKDDRERFARVDASPGRKKLEWDVIDPEPDESPSPGW